MVLCGLCCSVAHADPGALDPSFGTGGVQLSTLGNADDAQGLATAQTPGGGDVAVGSVLDSGTLELGIAQYTSSGRLDSAFGSGGIVTTNLGNTTSQADAVAVESDGDVLIAGSADTVQGDTDVLLALYSPTGQPVAGFGTNGSELLAVGDGGDAQANAVLIDGGSVLVTGNATQNSTTDAFFLSASDTTGAVNGSPTLISLGDNTTTQANAIALDGANAVIAGDASNNGTKDAMVSELNPSTSALVSGFGSSGSTLQAVGSSDAIAYGVVVESRGEIVVDGSVVSNGATDVLMAGFSSSGKLDPGFGSSAGTTQVAVGSGGNAAGASLALSPAGQLVLAGEATDAVSGQAANLPLVARFTGAGRLDTSFAPSAPLPGTELLECDNDSGFSGDTVQSNGEIVAAGYAGADSQHQSFLIARFLDTQSGSGSGAPGCSVNGGGTGPPPPPPNSRCKQETRTFGRLEVNACFAQEGAAWLASGTIDLDGLQLVPSPCTSLLFDSTSETMKTVCSQGGDGEVAVGIPVSGSTAIPLYQGSLDQSIPTADGDSIGQLLADAYSDLRGFPMVGDISSDANGLGSMELTVNTQFPSPFDVVTGSTSIQVSFGKGVQLGNLGIKFGPVTLGGFLYTELAFSYNPLNNIWTASGQVSLPIPLADQISALAKFRDASLLELSANASFSPGVPVGGGVFLTGAGLTVGDNPFTIGGSLDFALGPQIGGVSLIGVDAGFEVQFPPHEWAVELNGNVTLGGVPLASAYFEVDSDGNAFFDGSLSYGASFEMNVQAELQGWVSFPTNTFDAFAKATVTILPYSGTGEVDVSSEAISACVTVQVGEPPVGASATIGGAYVWGHGFALMGGFDIFGVKFGNSSSCDLSKYRPAAPASVIGNPNPIGTAGDDVRDASAPAHTAAAATGDQITVPAHQSVYVVELRGTGPATAGVNGTAPYITVAGPDGRSFSDAPGTASMRSQWGTILAAPENGATFVLLAHPPAGHWVFTPEAGSAITAVATATMLPAPSVRAHLSGHGYAWKLHYEIKSIPGQQVEFLETFGKVTNPIATVSAAHGTVSFRPAYGPGGPRTIIAQVMQGTSPRARLTVAHYTVPPIGPAKPTHLRVRRAGGSLAISWRGAALSASYVVIVHETAGAIRELLSHSTRVVFRGLPPFAGARVTVAGATRYGGTGPAASVTVSKPTAPKAIRAPSISGHAKVRATLTCTRGKWKGSPRSYATEWVKRGIPIVGATRTRLRVTSSLAGAKLACEVTARNAAGFASATSKAVRIR
jgi:uncharacterized delta-60 repeat protein